MSLKTRSRRDPWSTIMACLSQHYMLDLKLINTRIINYRGYFLIKSIDQSIGMLVPVVILLILTMLVMTLSIWLCSSNS